MKVIAKLLLKFTDWLVDCLEQGFREARPNMEQKDREDWVDFRKDYWEKSREIKKNI